ncbi:MAG: energy-coupling factor transporter ATPase [Oscillospiraceae bacterium]|nr:energy-coupling factor transporter ATPase [Oscillospiraceae bacterium]
MSKIFQTDNLTYTYPGDEEMPPTVALDGVTLDIERGSFVVVLGHNGSGKSTLAKTFNAVLLPSGGTVYVDGMDTADEALLLEIRRRIGMVFQNPDNQIVANVVEEDVAFAPENLGVPTEEIRRRVDDALEAVGMTEFTLHAPHLLSGGQKQRIAIAGVLAMLPECIVLDEATAMLDPMGRREVLNVIEGLHREKNITVVLITHHMNEAQHADRVVVMNDGHLVMDGTPKAVFARARELRDIGLAVPDTVALLRELKAAGMDVPVDAITVGDCADAIVRAFSGSTSAAGQPKSR